MKKVINAVLTVCVVLLAIICWRSIQDDINFDSDVAYREAHVKARLLQIKAAEEAFKQQNPEGAYCSDWNVLTEFVKNGQLPIIIKEGVLSDEQMEKGLTESKAAEIINSGDAKAIAEYKLEGFRRDTILTNMIQSLYKGQYTEETIGEIVYIPYTDNVKFEVETNNGYTTSQGIKVPIFEIRAHYNTYLHDLNAQERANIIDKEEKLDHYPGLKVGSIDAPNNNAGNWE